MFHFLFQLLIYRLSENTKKKKKKLMIVVLFFCFCLVSAEPKIFFAFISSFPVLWRRVIILLSLG
jgi:hypothetical protein